MGSNRGASSRGRDYWVQSAYTVWLHNATLCHRSKNKHPGAMSNVIKDLIETAPGPITNWFLEIFLNLRKVFFRVGFAAPMKLYLAGNSISGECIHRKQQSSSYHTYATS